MIDAAVTAAAEPVPSVLPEEGIDLAAELERYRMWLIEQALLRTNGNITRAGLLLGYSEQGLAGFLYRRDKGRTFRRGGARPRQKQEAAPAPVRSSSPPQPPPAAPAPVLQAERQLAKLMERIPWDRVEQLRAEGCRDWEIAKKLAGSLDTHRFAVKKALQRRRALETEAAPRESAP